MKDTLLFFLSCQRKEKTWLPKLADIAEKHKASYLKYHWTLTETRKKRFQSIANSLSLPDQSGFKRGEKSPAVLVLTLFNVQTNKRDMPFLLCFAVLHDLMLLRVEMWRQSMKRGAWNKSFTCKWLQRREHSFPPVNANEHRWRRDSVSSWEDGADVMRQAGLALRLLFVCLEFVFAALPALSAWNCTHYTYIKLHTIAVTIIALNDGSLMSLTALTESNEQL